MPRLSDLRIRTKIVLIVLAMSLMATGLIAYSLSTIATLTDKASTLVSRDAEGLKLAGDMNERITRLHQLTYAMILASGPQKTDVVAMIRERVAALDARVEALRPHMVGQAAAPFAEVSRMVPEFKAALREIEPLALAGRDDEARGLEPQPHRASLRASRRHA